MRLERLLGVGDWKSPPKASRRRFGVPPGGPWDHELAMLASALAGQPEGAPVFELLRGTAEFTVEEAGTVAFAGIDGSCFVAGDAQPPCSRFAVFPGSKVQASSNLAYLAFDPGSLPPGRLGQLPTPAPEIRYLPNGEAAAILRLRVDPSSSRAGVRLNGLPAVKGGEIPSEPSCVGAIQRTPSGQLIIIGPDGPTIGGYPKIGTVIEADLDLVPRLIQGTEVDLVPTTWDLARWADVERSERLGKRIAILRAGSRI